jgi:para-nitrobenzyl esterase
LAERKAAQRAASVYMYVTDWRTPVDGGKWRSPHICDLPLIFDNVDLASSMVGAEMRARSMAAVMSAAWIAFARNGDPDSPGLPHWPRYDVSARATMIFNDVSRVSNDPRGALRNLLQTA